MATHSLSISKYVSKKFFQFFELNSSRKKKKAKPPPSTRYTTVWEFCYLVLDLPLLKGGSGKLRPKT